MFAHFSNKIKPIGPIVVIVLDTITNADNTTSTLDIINGVGTITDNVVVDSLVVTDKILGTDYELKYNESGKLEVSELKDLGESISISYKKVDSSKIKPENVIGSYDEENETRTGIQAIQDVYEELNIIPEILAAPGYSHIKEIEQALVKATARISDRWEAICYTDINSDEADSREKHLSGKKLINIILTVKKHVGQNLKLVIKSCGDL